MRATALSSLHITRGLGFEIVTIRPESGSRIVIVTRGLRVGSADLRPIELRNS